MLICDCLDFLFSCRYDSSAAMTTFLKTNSIVFHMEPDLYIKNNIIFADGPDIKTTDGLNTTDVLNNLPANTSTRLTAHNHA